MRRRVASTELHIANSARAQDADVSWRTFCEAAGMNVLFLLLPSIRRYLKSGADASTRLPADWRLEGLRTQPAVLPLHENLEMIKTKKISRILEHPLFSI